MRTSSLAPSPAMLSEGSIFDTIVGNAVEIGLNAMGARHGLPAMQWRTWDLDSGPAIEGYPPSDCADPAKICLAWAHALELEEFTFDVGDGIRVWFLRGASWHVEIMTARPADADDADRAPALFHARH
jgi:hypothetical protein